MFADVDPRTLNLDAGLGRAGHHRPPRRSCWSTRPASPPTWTGSSPWRPHGLALVEDAACAIGARYKGRPIGSLGPLTCFSFHPRKVITTGEGGMITLQDPGVAGRLRQLREHGMDVSDLARHGARDVIIEPYPERGWNYRMTDMQAALGLVPARAARRHPRRAAAARRALHGRDRADPVRRAPYEPGYAERTWQSYAVTLAADAPIDRTELMRRLLLDGVPTRRGVMAIHEGGRLRRRARAELPQTESASRSSLMLPLFAGLTDEQQDRVIDCLAAQVTAVAA